MNFEIFEVQYCVVFDFNDSITLLVELVDIVWVLSLHNCFPYSLRIRKTLRAEFSSIHADRCHLPENRAVRIISQTISADTQTHQPHHHLTSHFKNRVPLQDKLRDLSWLLAHA